MLHLARLTWLVVTLISLGLFVSGLPARYHDIRTIYQGNIQVDLLRNPQGEYIIVTGPGSAAARAGVLDRDILLSIDGVSTIGLAMEQIQGMLAGAVGSTVQLSVRTGGFPPVRSPSPATANRGVSYSSLAFQLILQRCLCWQAKSFLPDCACW